MTMREHLNLLEIGDHRPRVVEHQTGPHRYRYVAWLPTWEGPARPDFAAAYVDLRERA